VLPVWHKGWNDVQIRYALNVYLTVISSDEFNSLSFLFNHYNAPPTAFTIHMAILTCKPTLRSVFA